MTAGVGHSGSAAIMDYITLGLWGFAGSVVFSLFIAAFIRKGRGRTYGDERAASDRDSLTAPTAPLPPARPPQPARAAH